MRGRENHQKAITRVAQWLDFSDEEEREFIQVSHGIAAPGDHGITHFDEEYLEHLEENVFTDPTIISYLEDAGISPEVVELFESQDIPFDEVYQSWNRIKYSTNEILDLTMLLKLVDSYSKQSEDGMVNSRFKLQKLVYFVNRKLVEQYRLESDTAPFDHGKLEKTGFRYTYRKRDSGPFSKDLQEDKYRLYASNLIEEELVEDSSTPEINEKHARFEISLGTSGEVMMNRFSNLLENLETDVLSDWEAAINDTVNEFGSMTIEELHGYVNSIKDIEEKEDRELLIRGRKVEYDSEPWLEVSAEGGFSHA